MLIVNTITPPRKNQQEEGCFLEKRKKAIRSKTSGIKTLAAAEIMIEDAVPWLSDVIWNTSCSILRCFHVLSTHSISRSRISKGMHNSNIYLFLCFLKWFNTLFQLSVFYSRSDRHDTSFPVIRDHGIVGQKHHIFSLCLWHKNSVKRIVMPWSVFRAL